MKKAIIFSLIAGGICFLAVILLIWHYQITEENLLSPKGGYTQVDRTQEIEISSDVTHLTLDLCGAEVIIDEVNSEIASSSSQVIAQENSRYFRSLDNYQPLMSQLGNELIISNCDLYNAQFQNSLNLGFNYEPTINITLTLPNHHSWSEIKINNLSSSQQFNGQLVAEQFSINNRSGGLDLGGLKLTGDLIDFQNSSGYLYLNQIQAQKMQISNHSGNIELLQSQTTDLISSNQSGTLMIDNLELLGSATLENSSGGLRVNDLIASGEIKLVNSSGSVNIDNSVGVFQVSNTSGNVDFADTNFLPVSQVIKNSSGVINVRGEAGVLENL